MDSSFFAFELDEGFDFGHVDDIESNFPDLNTADSGPPRPSDDISTAPRGVTNTATGAYDLNMLVAAFSDTVSPDDPAGSIHFGMPSIPVAQPCASPAQPQPVQNLNTDHLPASLMAKSQNLVPPPVRVRSLHAFDLSLRDNPISAAELIQSLIPPISGAHGGISPHNLRFGHGNDDSRDDPKELYCQLLGPPPSWARGHSVFHYTAEGELDLLYKFSIEEFMDYLKQPELVLLIQRTPSKHSQRYPNYRLSPKCRFSCCRALNRTISHGDFRVALNEHPTLYGNLLDPFHCAGYVHLWCLESKLGIRNMVRLYDQKRLVVHTNAIPLEDKDPMFINGAMNKAGPYRRYVKWFRLAKSWVNNSLHESFEGDQTLTWYMTKGMMEEQKPSCVKKDQARRATHFTKHMGNPEEKMRLKYAIKAAKPANEGQEKARGRTRGQKVSRDGPGRPSTSPISKAGHMVNYRMRDSPPLLDSVEDEKDGGQKFTPVALA